MKKNSPYLDNDEIELSVIIKSLWREKILILSITIISGFLGYLFVSFQTLNFKTEIKIKNPPSQLFEPYNHLIKNDNSNSNSNSIMGQFISDFNLSFLSLDNVEIFLEESRSFDNFKKYLKSKNITAKEYFSGKLGEVKEKNIIISNKYFLLFEEKLEGDIFFNNYAEFVKKKNIAEIKKNLKLTIENKIYSYEQALEIAKLLNIEIPILKSINNQIFVVSEPEALFYKGSKALSQDIINLKKLLQKLENDQFNYNLILDKASSPVLQTVSVSKIFVYASTLGFLLSLVIIFLKNTLKQKL